MAKNILKFKKILPGYSVPRAKAEQRIRRLAAILYNQFGEEEFTYSSIKLSKECGCSDYAAQYRFRFFAQTYQGNNLQNRLSKFRIRVENFDEEMHILVKEFSRDYDNVTVRALPEDVHLVRYVTFNLSKIDKAILQELKNTEIHHLMVIKKAILTYGFVENPHQPSLYTLGIPHSSKHGREYATWPFCLQQASKVVRAAAVHGDALDLNASAVQCMYQLGGKFGADLAHLTILKEYINNKAQYRTDLAAKYAVEEETIKCIFNILTLGGHGSPGQVKANYQEGNSIARAVGSARKAFDIVSDEFVKAFYTAVKEVRKLIVLSQVTDVSDGWVIKLDWKRSKKWIFKSGAKRKVRPIAKMMNFIYQQWELEVMTNNCSSDRGLPVHDCREGINENFAEIVNSFAACGLEIDVKTIDREDNQLLHSLDAY